MQQFLGAEQEIPELQLERHVKHTGSIDVQLSNLKCNQEEVRTLKGCAAEQTVTRHKTKDNSQPHSMDPSLRNKEWEGESVDSTVTGKGENAEDGNMIICPSMNINHRHLGGVSILRMFTTT